MSALKGSLSYVRFFVRGKVPDDFRDRYTKAIQKRVMKPLEPDEEALERSGWAVIGDPFDLELGYDNVFYNEYVNLGFRMDKWALPGPMLKAALREAEAATLSRKGREKMSRKEKAELKEMVARKLRRKVPPVTRAYDVSWSLNDGIVRFFSHSERAGAAMTEVFERTFDVELVQEAPYTLAARLGLKKDDEVVWAALEPTDLTMEAE